MYATLDVMLMIVPVPLDHLREHRLDEHDRREHVRFEMVAQHLHRGVDDEVHVAGPDVAAVVDEHVDAAPRVEHGRYRLLERRVVEQVRLHRQARRPVAHASAVLSSDPGSTVVSACVIVELCSAGLALVHGAGGDRDVVAGLGELDGDPCRSPGSLR